MAKDRKTQNDGLNGDSQNIAADRKQALRLAYCRAAEVGDTEMLTHLQKAGVDLISYADPLERAVQNGHTEAIDLMLPQYDGLLYGWQIDDILHAAVKSENTKIVGRILDWVDRKPG